MSEQISPHPEETAETSTPEELVDEAVLAFQKRDFETLDQTILKLGQELGVELETPIEEELKKNQKVLDFLFGEGRFNLKQEYLQGNIKLLSKEQQRQVGYTEILIVPGNLPRKEIVERFEQKYQQEFSSQGIYRGTDKKKVLEETTEAKTPTRPPSFYTLALKPQTEVNQAHPETINQDLAQAQETLRKHQKENPKLNFQGLTLPESLLFDAYQYTNFQTHLDKEHRSYLLAEILPDGRALYALWHPVSREVHVYAHSGASGSLGSRFAAVSSS